MTACCRKTIKKKHFAQTAGAVGYTDCISARCKTPPTPPNECPGYGAKQSDGEIPEILLDV